MTHKPPFKVGEHHTMAFPSDGIVREYVVREIEGLVRGYGTARFETVNPPITSRIVEWGYTYTWSLQHGSTVIRASYCPSSKKFLRAKRMRVEQVTKSGYVYLREPGYSRFKMRDRWPLREHRTKKQKPGRFIFELWEDTPENCRTFGVPELKRTK